MRRLFIAPVLAGAVISQVFGGMALAGVTQDRSAKGAEPGRVVYVCDNSQATRQAWVREFGEMKFITAEQLAAAQATNEAWSAPRCIAASELRRFKSEHSAAARLIRTEAEKR